MDSNPTVEGLLQSWELGEYIDIFTEQDINIDTLFSMSLEILKEIIPKVGPRCRFIKKRDDFLQQVIDSKIIIDEGELPEKNLHVLESLADGLNVPQAPEQSLPININADIPRKSEKPNPTQKNNNDGQKLRKLLEQSSTGRTVLSRIRLSNNDRKKLCHLIIDNLLAKSLKITSEEFRSWTEEITSLFKTEKPDIYYNPSCGQEKRLATGKLWDKYTNLRKYVKNNKENKLSKGDGAVVPVKESAVLTKLRNISPDDSQLLQYWKNTFDIRERGDSIEEYYDNYPVLKAPIGAELLETDFKLVTKTDEDNFLMNWPDVADRIVQYATEKKLCDILCNQAQGIPKETLALLILPNLFTPVPVPTKKKKSWKPSKSEISEAFILRMNTISDYEERITERRSKLHEFGLQLQPSVIAVGPLQNLSTYVVINDTKYVMSSLMGAVDLCFKSYYALNAHYAVDCEIVWQFLQSYLFNVSDKKHGKKFPSIHTLWLDLESTGSPDSSSSSSDESSFLTQH